VRAVHGDEDRTLLACGKVVDNLKQRRQTVHRGADSDEQVRVFRERDARRVHTLGRNYRPFERLEKVVQRQLRLPTEDASRYAEAGRGLRDLKHDSKACLQS
jgi:hypothetical protein